MFVKTAAERLRNAVKAAEAQAAKRAHVQVRGGGGGGDALSFHNAKVLYFMACSAGSGWGRLVGVKGRVVAAMAEAGLCLGLCDSRLQGLLVGKDSAERLRNAVKAAEAQAAKRAHVQVRGGGGLCHFISPKSCIAWHCVACLASSGWGRLVGVKGRVVAAMAEAGLCLGMCDSRLQGLLVGKDWG